MPDTKRKAITEEQWKRAADDYERGIKHATRIADELGVSASTVSREFKRRGCVKGSRVAEVIAPLEAVLEQRARRRAIVRRMQEQAALERAAANDRLIAEMMRAIIAAARGGDLTKAAPTIDQIGRCLGGKPAR